VQGTPLPCTNLRLTRCPTVCGAKNCARWTPTLHKYAGKHGLKPLSKVKNRRVRRPIYSPAVQTRLTRTEEDSCVRSVRCLVFLGNRRRPGDSRVYRRCVRPGPLVLLRKWHTRTSGRCGRWIPLLFCKAFGWLTVLPFNIPGQVTDWRAVDRSTAAWRGSEALINTHWPLRQADE
jgi:hypothetical protein